MVATQLTIEEEDAREIDLIEKALQKSDPFAYRLMLKAGYPATLVRGSQVITVYPDGHEEIIKEIPRQSNLSRLRQQLEAKYPIVEKRGEKAIRILTRRHQSSFHIQ